MSKAPCKECGVPTFDYIMFNGVCVTCLNQIEKIDGVVKGHAPLKKFTYDGFKGTKTATKEHKELHKSSTEVFDSLFQPKLKDSIDKLSYLTQKDLIEFSKPDPNYPWSENMSPMERAMSKTGKKPPETGVTVTGKFYTPHPHNQIIPKNLKNGSHNNTKKPTPLLSHWM